jgi:CheY-like chemotaxis protein
VDRPIGEYDRVKEGDYVVLSVSDTGTGIATGDFQKIFEPFYSTKKVGRSGSGLGLSVVYGIVKDHNGYIDVRTEMGVGSTFVIYLPVTRRQPEEKNEVSIDFRGTETVLVADDNEEQREVAARLLSMLGYSVATADSGRSAVEYLKKHHVDIVMLDMIMDDNFDGLDTFQRITQFRPKQKAIIVSGFSETERVKKAQQLGAGQYLRKPYTLERIGRALRQELDKDKTARLANQPE